MIRRACFGLIIGCAMCALAGCSNPVFLSPRGSRFHDETVVRCSDAQDVIPANHRRLTLTYELRNGRLVQLFLDGDPRAQYRRFFLGGAGIWHRDGLIHRLPKSVDVSRLPAHYSRGITGLLLVRFPDGSMAAALTAPRAVGRFISSHAYEISKRVFRYHSAPGVIYSLRARREAGRGDPPVAAVRTLERCRALRSNPLFVRWLCACGFLAGKQAVHAAAKPNRPQTGKPHARRRAEGPTS